MERTCQNNPGFSLVELVIVLAILIVISAIASPRYASSISNYRALLGAHRLASDIALAQATARATSATQTIVLDVPNSRYTVSGVAALDGRGGAYNVRLASDPYGASIGTVTFTDNQADATLAFNGFGAPDSGMTVQVRAGSRTCTVVVDAATGAATVQ